MSSSMKSWFMRDSGEVHGSWIHNPSTGWLLGDQQPAEKNSSTSVHMGSIFPNVSGCKKIKQYHPWDERYIYLHECLVFMVNVQVNISFVPWICHGICETATTSEEKTQNSLYPEWRVVFREKVVFLDKNMMRICKICLTSNQAQQVKDQFHWEIMINMIHTIHVKQSMGLVELLTFGWLLWLNVGKYASAMHAMGDETETHIKVRFLHTHFGR